MQNIVQAKPVQTKKPDTLFFKLFLAFKGKGKPEEIAFLISELKPMISDFTDVGDYASDLVNEGGMVHSLAQVLDRHDILVFCHESRRVGYYQVVVRDYSNDPLLPLQRVTDQCISEWQNLEARR